MAITHHDDTAPTARLAAARRALARLVAGAGGTLLNWVVPPICVGCRRPLVDPRTLCGSCWSELELITPPICPIMGTPLAYDAGPEARSPELRWNHPLYDSARAAAVFGPMSQRLVHQLKYHDLPGVARLMARMMAPAVRDITDGADCLVPVPLHRMRLASRKFNQAVALADQLSPLVGVPVERYAVRRVRRTKRQVGLRREERADNLHNAFLIAQPERLKNRVVVIVDDVLTSGATADALALSLKAVGVRAVHVAAFARVVGDVREPA